MKKKIIAISGSEFIDRSDFLPAYKKAYVSKDYVRSVQEAGALPIILPVLEEKFNRVTDSNLSSDIEQLITNVDGLILSGGHDINPYYYGDEPRQKLEEIWPSRDLFDTALLELAIKKSIPILGICRGFQLINAYFGAKLGQDLSYSNHELLKHSQEGSPDLATHKIFLTDKSRFFYPIFGDEAWVNSFHHQFVIDELDDLLIAAKSSDGVIEAIEHKTLPIFAVQWHPEMMSASDPQSKEIFRAFIKMCNN